MNKAIEMAKKAYSMDETPVGCVIVKDGVIIAAEHNTTIKDANATHHAEINAINCASTYVGCSNLSDCELYVTLEPCPMCAGAIINSKIKRVYIGAPEPKSGCFGSVSNFNTLNFNHKPEVYIGICEDECKQIMKDFFKGKR